MSTPLTSMDSSSPPHRQADDLPLDTTTASRARALRPAALIIMLSNLALLALFLLLATASSASPLSTLNSGLDAGWLSGYGESAIYVTSSDAFIRSRPAAFGPHVTETEGLAGQLAPANLVLGKRRIDDTNNRACPIPSPPSTLNETDKRRPERWIALVRRGGCPFAEKVREAQRLGALAAVVGDVDHESRVGDIFSGHPLLSMASSSDTSDIHIPSVFISSASYIELLRLYNEAHTHAPAGEDEPGLAVVMSKDEAFDWAMSDFLILLLFLPSVLTTVTLVAHRIRLARQRRLERAPQDAVDALPWVRWGEEEEKPSPPSIAEPNEQAPLLPSNSTSKYQPRWRRFFSRRGPAPSEDVPLQPNSKPLPFSAISRQRIFGVETECSICLSTFDQGDAVRILPCGHLMHAACVDPWLLKTKRMCPVCRSSITAESPSTSALSAIIRSRRPSDSTPAPEQSNAV